MVALYWLLNRLLTYWFINDVFPTLATSDKPLFFRTVDISHPLSPRMITCTVRRRGLNTAKIRGKVTYLEEYSTHLVSVKK